MEDFRVKTSWRTSRKRKMLKRSLGVDAVLAIQDLWSYCASEREDGDLSGLSNEEIAAEADWDGDADEWIAVLVKLTLLDGAEGTYRIHDWEDHNPYVASGKPRSEAGEIAAHERWHVGRGEFKAGCRWCEEAKNATDASGNAELCDRIDRNAIAYATDANGNAPTNTTNLPTNHGVVGVREQPLSKLEDELVSTFGKGIPAKWVPTAEELKPFSTKEIAEAIMEAKGESRPNPGLVMAILQRYRADEQKGPRAGPRRRPQHKIDPRYGSHPGSGDDFDPTRTL